MFAHYWLTAMGVAAQQSGVNIQYCMAWPRHFFESLDIESVTQIRVSGDYQPGNTQWRIGDTTILAEALSVAAFKDVSVGSQQFISLALLYKNVCAC